MIYQTISAAAAANGEGASGAELVNIEDARERRRRERDDRPTPFDRLPVEWGFGRPDRLSPYWTARSARQREEAIVRLGFDRVAAAAKILFKYPFGADPNGYAGVFEHNAITLAAALATAEAGLRVVDCHALRLDGLPTDTMARSGKAPRGAQWQREASTDPKRIKARWTGKGRYPENKAGDRIKYYNRAAPRNWGIATGGDIFAVDLDGEAGAAWLAEHREDLPATVENVTGSGGRHLLYRLPAEEVIRNTASSMAPGVDIRGEGGVIVAGLSIHPSGNFYTFEAGRAPWECRVAEAPAWLIEEAKDASKTATKTKARTAIKRKPAEREEYDSGDRPEGFDAWCDAIGDGDGLRGFYGPTFSAAMSWFATYGDADGLKDALSEAILAAPCDDDRAVSRYATDDYLDETIERARQYIEELTAEEAAEEDPEGEEGRPASAGIDDEDAAEAAPDLAVLFRIPALLTRAEELAKDASDEDVTAIMSELINAGADTATRNRVTTLIVKGDADFGRADVKRMWKETGSDIAAKTKAAEIGNRMLPAATGADKMVERTVKALRGMNREDPSLFHYVDGLAVIRPDPSGISTIKILSREAELANIIHDLGLFAKKVGSGEKEKIESDFPPWQVVQHVWTSPPEGFALPLAGVKTSPYFDEAGELVTENGYHPPSRMYLKMPDGAALDLDPEWTPTAEEVAAARDMLVDVVADFPLGGMTREETKGAVADDGDVPALCGLFAYMLLPFCREMIAGPTPGHFFAKPKPGTGASLLCDVVSIIATGRKAPAMGLPESREETEKTITSILAKGSEIALFDNIAHNVDSSALASAMTAGRYSARILGKTQTVDVPVRTIWGFTGNNITMSGELLRRCIPIRLDAKVAHPEERTGFKHENVKAYAEEHRWQLVSACLTLIQNWIAKGRQAGTAPVLASYEEWSRVMSGILDAAGLKGFMADVAEWKDDASDESDDSVERLLSTMAEAVANNAKDGKVTVFRPAGSKKPQSLGKVLGDKDAAIIGICDLLNGLGDPATNEEPIVLKGWSYREVHTDAGPAVVYGNPSKVGKQMRALARVPFAVLDEEGEPIGALRLAEHTDTKNSGRFWVASIEPAEPPGETTG